MKQTVKEESSNDLGQKEERIEKLREQVRILKEKSVENKLHISKLELNIKTEKEKKLLFKVLHDQSSKIIAESCSRISQIASQNKSKEDMKEGSNPIELETLVSLGEELKLSLKDKSKDIIPKVRVQKK